MKLSTKIYLLYFLMAAHFSYGQTSNPINKVDTSFTLLNRLRQDKQDIAQHGIFFNEKKKQFLKDFETIRALSLTDLSKYQKQINQQDGHLLKIWSAKNASEKVSAIIEIHSIYRVDTADDGSRLTDTVIYNDYFLLLRDKRKNVHYQTIDRQGLSQYSIGNRNVSVHRELMLTALLYVDNTEEIKKLLNKYNYGQQVHLQ